LHISCKFVLKNLKDRSSDAFLTKIVEVYGFMVLFVVQLRKNHLDLGNLSMVWLIPRLRWSKHQANIFDTRALRVL